MLVVQLNSLLKKYSEVFVINALLFEEVRATRGNFPDLYSERLK